MTDQLHPRRNSLWEYACEHPERPRIDRVTIYEWQCPDCVKHAITSLVTQGDSRRLVRQRSGGLEYRTLRDQVEKQAPKFGLPVPLPPQADLPPPLPQPDSPKPSKRTSQGPHEPS